MRGWPFVVLAACGNDGANSSADARIGGIEAPLEQWTYVPIDGVTCGNGSPSGIGVNLSDHTDDVVIYFQGGGACWDALTCFGIKSAINLENDYTATNLATDTNGYSMTFVGQRTSSDNPFRDASWVFVPYCTGDLHAGTLATTYDVAGTPRMVHHVGGLNADAIFAAVAATRPNAQTVWIVGTSAGGYGVSFNVAGARAAWPGRPVHVLADSSPLVTMEPTRWQTMQREWGIRFPAACTECDMRLGALPAALASEAPAGHRYGLLAYTQDGVISTYFGIGGADLEVATLAQQSAMSGDRAAFVLAGTQHVVLANPAQQADGVTALAWVQQWAAGTAGWSNQGP